MGLCFNKKVVGIEIMFINCDLDIKWYTTTTHTILTQNQIINNAIYVTLTKSQ